MRVGTISKLVLAGALALTVAGVSGAPAMAAPVHRPVAPAATSAGTMTSSVSGTFTDAAGATGTLTGTFTPTRFAVQNGQVVATGILHMVPAGAPVTLEDTQVTLPVQLPGANDVGTLALCPVLHLVLGPLDLNLLGVLVHLNTVVLDITAQSGPGNLLGNLLCAITNLLNGGIVLPLPLLVQLLNQILALLGL
jgi:hypothetical protein